MENLDYIRERAFLYFNGKLELAKEKELFDALKNNKKLQEQFQEWEKIWMESDECSPSTQQEWERLSQSINKTSQRHSMTRLWGRNWIKVAAAVTLVFMLSFSAGWFASNLQTKEIYYTSYAPLGEKSQVALPDGTKVWLNAGSSLTYSNHFGEVNRKVSLKGEGYFEVAKNKDLKFIVNTANHYQVVVKGTKFNLSAYDDDPYVSTSLLEGSLEVNYMKQSVTLKPGQMAKLVKKDNKVTCSPINNLSQTKAWSEGRIEFDKITLSELLPKLHRIYNTDIEMQLNDTSISNRTIRISLRNRETLEEVFAALKRILPIDVVRQCDKYTVK